MRRENEYLSDKMNGKTYETEFDLNKEGKPNKVHPAPVTPKLVVQNLIV